MKVEGVVAGAPRDGALLVYVLYLVRLALDTYKARKYGKFSLGGLILQGSMMWFLQMAQLSTWMSK